jgi:hypothetical protein
MRHVSFRRCELTELAQYLAELERQNVAYKVDQDDVGFEVTITGH